MNPGLCSTCRHVRVVTSGRGSTFWQCRHPDLPKYPPIPVRSCRGYERTPDVTGGQGSAAGEGR